MNPLWLYAKTAVHPTFIETLKQLPNDKQSKIIENIKLVNKIKFKQLQKEINNNLHNI